MTAPDNGMFAPLAVAALPPAGQSTGVNPPSAPDAERKEAERKAAMCVFRLKESVADHPLLDAYLSGERGIPKAADGWPENVRLHPGIPYHITSGPQHPAMVMPKTAPDGAVVGLHAVFLDGQGRKVALDPAKKSYGRGGVVVIRATGSLLLATEGPEDILTVATACPHAAAICTAGAGTLQRVADYVPPGCEAVILCADRDPGGVGEAAARKAAAIIAGRGVPVRIALPPEGIKDANALLKERGMEAVRAMIKEAVPVDVLEPSPDGAAFDQAAEITRLAALSPIDYDKQRKAAADRLGCSVGALDAEIIQIRKQATGKDKGGGPLVAADARGRSDLEVNSADLPDTAVELAGFLARQPMIFDRGGPAKLTFDEQRGGLVAGLLNVNSVVNECHQIARPFVWEPGDEGPKKKYITIPERVAKLYLALKGQWGLRPLDGIAQAPLLNEGGDMRAVDGYDPPSRLWCEKVPAVEVPPRPNRKDAEAALVLLRTALRTFAFADAEMVDDPALKVKTVNLTSSPGQDETAALAAILTAVCRPSLWLAPGVAVRAPAFSGAGTGKGLLCRVICAIAYGQRPQALTAGGTPEEFDKRVTAALIGAEAVLFLDNINGTTLKSDILASILTERPCYVRPLGRSATVPLNASTLVLVTGNGLMLSEDLARRFLVVELDAGMEDPEARNFPGDLLADLMTRRSDLLQAALIIWRWGQQNPAELERGKPLGSFEQWCKWVRDPLLTLGCADPAEKVAATKSNDPRRRAIAELFNAWWEAHSNNPVAIAELTDRVRMVADPQNKGRQYLAAYIRRLEGTRAAGFVLTRNDAAGKWTQTGINYF